MQGWLVRPIQSGRPALTLEVYKSVVISTHGGAFRTRLVETGLESCKDDVAGCMRNTIVSLGKHTREVYEPQ